MAEKKATDYEPKLEIGEVTFSRERDQITAAMFAVQKKLNVVAHDSTGEVKKGGALLYSYNYTSLPGLLHDLLPLLHENDLLLVGGAGHTYGLDNAGAMSVTTAVVHVPTGQWAQTSPPMVTSGAGQAVGSGMSFGRRYGILALFGLVTEDDDGKKATESLDPEPEDETLSDDILMGLPVKIQKGIKLLGWDAKKARAMLTKFVDPDGTLDVESTLAYLSRALDVQIMEEGK